MNADLWSNAVGVLKSSTRQMLAAQVGRQGLIVIDGWCATNPKQMKAWEKDGTLLERAKGVQEQASDALAQYARDKASNPGLPALANHEIYEIYGKPQLML